MGAAAKLPARILGRYALGAEIASGGMATVHVGRLLGPEGFARTVAIKRLHPQYAKDPAFVRMFLDEARTASRIHHPNVVPVLDVVTVDDEIFLVMEYVRGESLAALAAFENGYAQQVPPAIALGIVSSVLHGLHAAHEVCSDGGEPLLVVHRDVSPHNVLVDVDGVARVTDFGVAKARHRAQSSGEGHLKGKLAYMAPEQLQSGDVDRRTDVFAASVVLWQLLAGRPLFGGADPGQTLLRILSNRVPSLVELVPGLPVEMDAIVRKGLAHDKHARFATAREMALALEQTWVLATPAEIGGWVWASAAEAIRARDERLAEIAQRADASQPGVSRPRAEARPIAVQTAGPGDVTLVRPAASAVDATSTQERSRGRWVWLTMLGVAGAVALGLALRMKAHVAAVEPATAAPTVVATSAPATASAGTTGEPASSAAAPEPAPASTSASTAEPARARPVSRARPVEPAKAAHARSAAKRASGDELDNLTRR